MNKRYLIEEYRFEWSKKYKKIISNKLKDKRKRLIKREDRNGKFKYIDPELSITDCTKEFLRTNRGAKKSEGHLYVHKDIKPNKNINEKETGEWFAREFGWDMFVDKENSRPETGEHAYVDLFNGRKWWEEKSPSTITAIDGRTKIALEQLAEMPKNTRGGFVLNIRPDSSCKLSEITNDEIKQVVIDRINETSRIDCYGIIRRNNKVICVLKCKHKKSNRPLHVAGGLL